MTLSVCDSAVKWPPTVSANRFAALRVIDRQARKAVQERLGDMHFEKGAAGRTYRKEMSMLVHPGMTFYRLESLNKADPEYESCEAWACVTS